MHRAISSILQRKNLCFSKPSIRLLRNNQPVTTHICQAFNSRQIHVAKTTKREVKYIYVYGKRREEIDGLQETVRNSQLASGEIL